MKIVIDGAGEVGSHLAKMLRAEGGAVTVIDDDEARLGALAGCSDVETVSGSPTSLKVLRRAGVDKADLFIAVYPFAPQEVNLVAALLAGKLGAGKVVARINDEDCLSAENKLIFKELGIELMFYPEKIAADEIVSALRHNSSGETLDFARGKLQITTFKLDEDSPLLDLRLDEFIATVTPEDLRQFRVVAISREGKTLIPRLETKFRFGDLVYAISLRDGVDSLFRHFGKNNTSARDVMILGGSAIAEMVARMLAGEGVAVKIIEKDRERCVELSEKLPDSVEIICGDGRNTDLLYDEGIGGCDAFVALTSRDETNVLACVGAKKFGVQRTIAEVENLEYTALAEEMGVDSVINKKLITAGRIFKYTLSGKARFVRYMTSSDAEVVEYTAPPGSAITKAAVRDLDFPAGSIICGIVRGSESMIAVGDTRIEAYDRVAIFSGSEHIREIDRFFK